MWSCKLHVITKKKTKLMAESLDALKYIVHVLIGANTIWTQFKFGANRYVRLDYTSSRVWGHWWSCWWSCCPGEGGWRGKLFFLAPVTHQHRYRGQVLQGSRLTLPHPHTPPQEKCGINESWIHSVTIIIWSVGTSHTNPLGRWGDIYLCYSYRAAVIAFPSHTEQHGV